jgi:hypothetical protein
MEPQKPQADHIETKNYETRDMNLRVVINSLIGLAVLVVVSLLLMWGLFYLLLAERRSSIDIPLPPLAASQEPPEPRLQAVPKDELETLRLEEETLLNGYSWVNKEAGVVRIPIERAMELTLERGLPERENRE